MVVWMFGIATAWSTPSRVEAGWLWDAIGALPRSDRWQTQARSALRDDLLAVLCDLTRDALELGSLDQWRSLNERLLARTSTMFLELRRVDVHDLTTLTVGLRQLRNLAISTLHSA
jgi:glutamate dehydrogenase